MTTQEAIKNLDTMISELRLKGEKIGEVRCIDRVKIRTFKLAIEALEKQIAKKIENRNGQASCPCCQKLFGSIETLKTLRKWEMPHCKWCGQKIDWTVE